MLGEQQAGGVGPRWPSSEEREHGPPSQTLGGTRGTCILNES